jgi:IS605 OrfB family transposase
MPAWPSAEDPRDDAVPVRHRTARIHLRCTPAQARRALALLRCAGDVWAGLIELNQVRFRRKAKSLLSYQELCREVAGVRVGELSMPALRSVLRRYADACMETARRKRIGEKARYPRRKKRLVPVRYYAGTFLLDDKRLRLSVSRGAPELWLPLARSVPYPPDQVRSVTLLVDAGRLAVDVTAEVPIEEHRCHGAAVAGVDLGIIHPFAVCGPKGSLLVSGRVIRAEERLHLADTKARAKKTALKTPRRGQRGSRRWRELRANQRRAQARHLRRVRQAHHEAAKAVVSWAISEGIGTLVVGDPKGIAQRRTGRKQNRRVANTWRRTHLVSALSDKAEIAGIDLRKVDERGTSSTCPECRSPTSKPRGRNFVCPNCGYQGPRHRGCPQHRRPWRRHHDGAIRRHAPPSRPPAGPT